MSRRVLLTGAGGFIGSHVIEHLLLTTDWEIIALDSFRHKGLTDRLTSSEHFQKHRTRVCVWTHDLTVPISPLLAGKIGRVDTIINMASESHVERSITDPVPFVENNVKLALTMLEYARHAPGLKAFIQISTDEVYGPIGGDQICGHKEWSTILPSNPYSASKAAQEALAISYWRTYGVPLIITNTMNNFGERQDPEKFVPKVIRALRDRKEISVHGRWDTRLNEYVYGSRFYLHARSHADALLHIIRTVEPQTFGAWNRPNRFNVVGDVRWNNAQVVEKIAVIMGRPAAYTVEDFHRTRPGHDPHYGLDGTRLMLAGWKNPVAADLALQRTVEWYLNNPTWLEL